MKFEKIYLEGSEFFINYILKLAKERLGEGCNAISMNPELKEEDVE